MLGPTSARGFEALLEERAGEVLLTLGGVTEVIRSSSTTDVFRTTAEKLGMDTETLVGCFEVRLRRGSDFLSRYRLRIFARVFSSRASSARRSI